MSTRATAEEFLRRIGEPDRIGELFADDVEWRLSWPAGAHPATPWIRERSTRAEAADHFRELAGFHVPEHNGSGVSRILVDGDDAVILCEIRQRARPTGRDYTAMCALHLTVEDGLIVRYDVYEDSLSVARAFGG
ncbi:nuclear transport factor 2 family protein [Saccharopolyspora taberi]|uniref:Nuclear transport factor 2 family protein n=1 Tax=Saccharopolyspora taberi TaxID=60895 RepID=A0ABN3VER3_9PSEU